MKPLAYIWQLKKILLGELLKCSKLDCPQGLVTQTQTVRRKHLDLDSKHIYNHLRSRQECE